MQNLLSRIFQSRIARPVVKWFRSSKRAQPERSISPEEFFAAFKAMMNDPEQARLYRKTLMGMVMPFEGAMPCNTSATDVGPGTFGTGTGCSPQGGNYQFGSTTVASQVGIGVAPSYPLHVESSPTATSGNQISFYGLTTANPTGNSSAAYLASLYVGMTQSGNAANYTGIFYSFSPQTYHKGTGTMSNAFTIGLWSENTSTGTITNLHAIDVNGRNASTGTIGSNAGVYIHDFDNSNGGVITNNFGIFIETIAAGSENYAIFSQGGKSYFGGNVGIGTSSPGAKLDVYTGNNATLGLAIRSNGSSQTANLQEWQDSSGTALASVNAAGAFIGAPGMIVSNASFSIAAGQDTGSATFAAADGGMEARMGTTANSVDDTVGGILNINNLSQTEGLTKNLNKSGAFVSTRCRWTSDTAATNRQFYILIGWVGSGTLLYSGFGFRVDGNALFGIIRLNGSETSQNLSYSLTPGTYVALLAVCRGASSVQFYVNGALVGSISSTMPTSAASTYEIKVTNGASPGGNDTALQVGCLAIGFPM